MGHEVKARHQEDQVDQKQPVACNGYFALFYEGLADIALTLARLDLAFIRLGLGEEESPDDEDDGWTGAEPEQRTPAMRRGIHKPAGESSREEIAERVALLHNTAHQTPSFRGKIFQRGGRRIAVEAPHGHAKKCAARKKLGVGVAKPGALGFVAVSANPILMDHMSIRHHDMLVPCSPRVQRPTRKCSWRFSV